MSTLRRVDTLTMCSRALLDPRVLQIGLVFLCMLGASYAYQFSAPAILQRVTGLSTTNVGFLIAGMGLLGALAMILNAMHSDRTGERYWHVIIPVRDDRGRLCGRRLVGAPVAGGARSWRLR